MSIRQKHVMAMLVIFHSLIVWSHVQASDIDYEYLFSFRHDDIITCADFSGNGKWLATGSEVGTIIITDLATKDSKDPRP